MASDIEIITIGENTIGMKTLIYPLEMESSNEVVAMITSFNKEQVGPLMIQGVANKVEKIPVEVFASEPIVLTAIPQSPVVSLKAAPWTYGTGLEETSECTIVLSKNNPLILPK